MPHDLVLATHNRGKLEELRHLLAGIDVRVLAIGDVTKREITVVEDGDTFEANARRALRGSGRPTPRTTPRSSRRSRPSRPTPPARAPATSKRASVASSRSSIPS